MKRFLWMRLRWATRPLSGVMAAVAVTCVGMSACGGEESKEPPPPEHLSSVFEGVQMVRQEPEGTVWRLTAREGRAWEGEGSGWLHGVEAVIERKGRSVRLDAGTAGMQRREVITFSDGVVLAWEGFRAETERATYERRQGRIVSGEAVRIEGPGLEVTGRGLEADVEGRRVRVLSEVRTVFREEGP